jgi:hypothetical protein
MYSLSGDGHPIIKKLSYPDILESSTKIKSLHLNFNNYLLLLPYFGVVKKDCRRNIWVKTKFASTIQELTCIV